MLELTQANVDRAERNESAKELADQISRFVNTSGLRGSEQVALLMMRDHPTLLQQKMAICVRFIELMSQRKGDLRTEASEQLAKKMVEATTDAERHLPLI